MRIQVAHTHSYVRPSPSPFRPLPPFDPIPRLFYVPCASVPLFCLVRAILAASPRLLLLPLFFFFFFFQCPCRRFVLFSFCLFSRLRTGSLHSRAPRVEGPRQGKPVSRVRVISPCRHARSSMTFRARTPRECNTNDAPARSSDRRFSPSVHPNCTRTVLLTLSLDSLVVENYFSISTW